MSLAEYRLNKRVSRDGQTEYIVETKQNGKWKTLYASILRGFALNQLRGKSFVDLTKGDPE